VATAPTKRQFPPVIHDTSYSRPRTDADARSALALPGARALGGGTDALPLVKEGIDHPASFVDLRQLPDAATIRVAPDGGVWIGAAARLADLAADPDLRSRFPALTESCGAVGTPALRNMGTIGGNLAQRIRCWYFRRGVTCFKNGGDSCAAVGGENQYHAIFTTGTCHAVHPSDPAVALAALDADLSLIATDGSTRRVRVLDFYAGATTNPRGETVLAAGERIEAVLLPAASAGGTQQYHKLMQRGAWDFALVSLAAVKRADGDVRLVLGGVASGPMRVNASIEEDVASGALDEESVLALAERAMYDAVPMEHNGYKVQQAASLLRDAMFALSRA
jgi:xanthine dehydrogenase YagS FAD-binding subunit